MWTTAELLKALSKRLHKSPEKGARKSALRAAFGWLRGAAEQPPEPLPRHETCPGDEQPEVPCKLCVHCQTAYRMAGWLRLPLIERSDTKTEGGRYPAWEKRFCSQCGERLELHFQHYEDFDYRVAPSSQYNRAYGLD